MYYSHAKVFTAGKHKKTGNEDSAKNHTSGYACLTLFRPNGIFRIATLNKVRMVYCMYRGVTGHNFKNIVLLTLKIDPVLANSADPNEMLGLQCLPKYWLKFRGFMSTKCYDLKSM